LRLLPGEHRHVFVTERNPGHKLIDNTYVIVSSDNGGAQTLRNWPSRDGKVRPEKVTDIGVSYLSHQCVLGPVAPRR
jgi:hypothetical protein